MARGVEMKEPLNSLTMPAMMDAPRAIATREGIHRSRTAPAMAAALPCAIACE